ncbi:ATP-binding protein [Microbacterium sp.]|uniref:sensor histidine kinase n=1 Tax=Microbacterium sp. TaxID=51671 RepID=UPI0037362AD1
MSTRATSASSASRALAVLPWVYWIGGPLAIFLLGIFGASLRATALPIAVWWPAVGVALWFVLRAPKRRKLLALLLVFGVTVLSNYAAGRPIPLALIYGAINTAEVALVITFLDAWRRPFRLHSFACATRFVLSILAAALIAGTLIGITGYAFSGVPAQSTAAVAFASHSSAMMLLAPFAVLPPRIPEAVRPLELGIYAVCAAAAIIVAFGRISSAPLAFLVFAILTWGALRFPMGVALTQSTVIAVTVLAVVLSDAGSFSGVALGEIDAAITLVTFMSAVGIFTVLVVASRYEGRVNAALALTAAHDVAEAERERERAAALGMQLDLERQREDFVTATSHELRTPATNILGYSELLVAADLPDDATDWSRAVHRSATRLKSLLDDLHQSAGMAGTAIEPIAVDDLIDDVRAAHLPDAEARGTVVEIHGATGLVAAASAIDARRALWSLVSNAIKFSAQHRVTITAHRDGDEVVIVVTDDGPGMAPDTLANAFTRFYRGAEAAAASAAGLGLGLANAQELATRNGGEIRLDSALGRGTRASLVLPAAP